MYVVKLFRYCRNFTARVNLKFTLHVLHTQSNIIRLITNTTNQVIKVAIVIRISIVQEVLTFLRSPVTVILFARRL